MKRSDVRKLRLKILKQYGESQSSPISNQSPGISPKKVRKIMKTLDKDKLVRQETLNIVTSGMQAGIIKIPRVILIYSCFNMYF